MTPNQQKLIEAMRDVQRFLSYIAGLQTGTAITPPAHDTALEMEDHQKRVVAYMMTLFARGDIPRQHPDPDPMTVDKTEPTAH